MTIVAGNDIVASDFVSTSSGAGDSGKVAKLNASGKIPATFLRGGFGGTGADGALTITSGTTNIDLAGSQIVVKNYTSISITGTGKLTFTNPHANGTVIIFKSQGNVTLTSSATPNIDLRLLGASGGANAFGSGVGGRGGGALYIECAGALNYTGTIDATGQNGTSNTGGTATGGNAGGAGGTVVILANTITANTGTTTVTGGTTSAGIGGGTPANTNGSNGSNSIGLRGVLAGGNGAGNTNTTVPTNFGIVPTLATMACKYIPLMCGSGGGGGGYIGGIVVGSVGSGLGGGSTGVAISGLNTEFV